MFRNKFATKNKKKKKLDKRKRFLYNIIVKKLTLAE